MQRHDPTTVPTEKQGQALSIRLWLGCLATQEMLCNYLGIRLGLYEALADGGPATAPELARRAGIAPRYAREWLEQQAVSGIVHVDRDSDSGDQRVFALPDGHRAVLTDWESPLSRLAGILPLGAVAQALPELMAAYRSGDGLTDPAYGPDWRRGHGGANRPLYVHGLADWIRTGMPDVHARLSAPGARAADVGCGAGWAAIALARAYRTLHVDGFEVDPGLLEDATANAQHGGAADRVKFHLRDGCAPAAADNYDLVCVFDTLHEVPDPVALLRGCGAISAHGTVVVMDAKVADRFTAPANEIERFQYTTSVLHCLPVCLAGHPSAATGTAMRPDIVRRYARTAGFQGIEELAIAERFHRFYRLTR